jgi:hypothetical protein
MISRAPEAPMSATTGALPSLEADSRDVPFGADLDERPAAEPLDRDRLDAARGVAGFPASIRWPAAAKALLLGVSTEYVVLCSWVARGLPAISATPTSDATTTTDAMATRGGTRLRRIVATPLRPDAVDGRTMRQSCRPPWHPTP